MATWFRRSAFRPLKILIFFNSTLRFSFLGHYFWIFWIKYAVTLNKHYFYFSFLLLLLFYFIFFIFLQFSKILSILQNLKGNYKSDAFYVIFFICFLFFLCNFSLSFSLFFLLQLSISTCHYVPLHGQKKKDVAQIFPPKNCGTFFPPNLTVPA